MIPLWIFNSKSLVSFHVSAISITLSLFGSFVRCFYLAMLFSSSIQCFHLAICASMPATLIFILTLEWLARTVVPKDGKVDQPAVPKFQSVSTLGGPKISEGIQYFRRIWTGGPTTTGVQILHDSPYVRCHPLVSRSHRSHCVMGVACRTTADPMQLVAFAVVPPVLFRSQVALLCSGVWCKMSSHTLGLTSLCPRHNLPHWGSLPVSHLGKEGLVTCDVFVFWQCRSE